MEQSAKSRGWWEIVTVVFAVLSVAFGVVAGSEIVWGLLFGFVPGVMLLAGLKLRGDKRMLATALITVASITAAFAYWMVYPVILAAVVVVGGFATGSLGPDRSQPAVS